MDNLYISALITFLFADNLFFNIFPCHQNCVTSPKRCSGTRRKITFSHLSFVRLAQNFQWWIFLVICFVYSNDFVVLKIFWEQLNCKEREGGCSGKRCSGTWYRCGPGGQSYRAFSRSYRAYPDPMAVRMPRRKILWFRTASHASLNPLTTLLKIHVLQNKNINNEEFFLSFQPVYFIVVLLFGFPGYWHYNFLIEARWRLFMDFSTTSYRASQNPKGKLS